MKRLSSILHKSLGLAFLLLAVAAPAFPARAQTSFSQPCVGPTSGYTTTDKLGASDVATIQGAECLVANILASVITLIGIAAFVMFLVGGFQYLTAGANAKGIEQGKNSITYAILGIVVALASFLIVNVVARLTGVTTILNFSTQLPTPTP